MLFLGGGSIFNRMFSGGGSIFNRMFLGGGSIFNRMYDVGGGSILRLMVYVLKLLKKEIEYRNSRELIAEILKIDENEIDRL